MKKFKLIFLLSLTLFSILGTTSFASDWNFDYEKSVYYDVAENFKNLDYTYSGTFKTGMFTETFIEQFFNEVENFLENSEYNQSDYPYMLVCRPTSSYVLVYLIKNVSNPNDYRIWTGTNIELTYYFNSDYSFNRIQKSTMGYSNADICRYQSSNSKPEGMFLSKYNGTYGSITSSYIPYFSSASKYGKQFSSTNIDNINLDDFNTNFILNKEFVVGNNYNFTINYYYYDDNDNKVDITEYVTLNPTEYWYGVDYAPFISTDSKQNLVPNEEYYMDLKIVGKNGISNFNKEYTEMVFTTNNVNDPDIPDDTESGDTGGGTGSGTTTPDYSEDLENIQTGITDINNNLGNIQESIPTSGEIAGATEQGNKDYWGNKDEMNEEDYENQISDGINESMEQITEELEQNEVFDSIAIAEQKIIDLFLEEPEDFKIEWQDVKYMNRILVSKGEINFSQICRENETLGNVKNILNIIVSAMISLSIFKYIFNLIMVTLGIDHPLILEAEKDDITEISRTKIGNKTYVTKKTYKSEKKGGR